MSGLADSCCLNVEFLNATSAKIVLVHFIKNNDFGSARCADDFDEHGRFFRQNLGVLFGFGVDQDFPVGFFLWFVVEAAICVIGAVLPHLT